jgi:hypothetical protein
MSSPWRFLMAIKKLPLEAVKEDTVNFSTRLPKSYADRVANLANDRDWTLGKTIQKLVIAALDAKLLK